MKKKYRADLSLILSLLAAGALLALFLLLGSRTGDTVQIRVAGSVVSEYPLNRDLSCIIHGADGGENTLVIHDGRAWLEEATCPDGLCVNTGKIDTAGQAIVCLPNRVVVEIRAEDATADADAGVDVTVG